MLLAVAWLAVVLLFASQWYLYDATRHSGQPFRYYVGWSTYIWGVLTPLTLWLARRWPLNIEALRSNLPRHIAASVLLASIQLLVEASFGWWRHSHILFSEALRHYFTQHAQISLLTYWVLVGSMKVRTIYDESRMRTLRFSQIEAKLTQIKLEALRGQLQPHFLFNTLQAATTLIYEDPEGAEEILLSLSELLRFSLEELRDQEVPLGQEIRFLRAYLAIQQRRFGDRLRCDVRIDEDLHDLAVPSLLLQPLVENAIRHGIGAHNGSDFVSVAASREGDRLRIEIRNQNSVLVETADHLSYGVGLTNTTERLEQLYGHRHSIKIQTLEPKGVEVVVSLPARRLAGAGGSRIASEVA